MPWRRVSFHFLRCASINSWSINMLTLKLVRVSEHLSGLGRWRVAQRSADLRLQAYVHGFLASEGYIPSALQERHMPSLEVPIVLNFASPHRTLDPSDPNRVTEHTSAWVVGLQSCHQICEAVGARDFMVVRLTPIGAHLVLKTPMDLLTDHRVDLEQIDGPLARLLITRVQGTRGWEARFRLVELLLAARVASTRPPLPVLIHSWQRLLKGARDIDLALLSSQSGWSRRHLIAQFHRHFGMAPKMIARIRRFHLAVEAANRLGRKVVRHPEAKPYVDLDQLSDPCDASQTDLRWANLALDCGYYDQSHFIKEFRALAGLTPVEFLRHAWPGETDPTE
jgi:AraC-like DNA-binding protein